MSEIKLEISVDTHYINETIEKAIRLVELIKEVNELNASLSSKYDIKELSKKGSQPLRI